MNSDTLCLPTSSLQNLYLRSEDKNSTPVVIEEIVCKMCTKHALDINQELRKAVGEESYDNIASACGVAASGGFLNIRPLQHVASERTFTFIQAFGEGLGVDERDFIKKLSVNTNSTQMPLVLPCSKTPEG